MLSKFTGSTNFELSNLYTAEEYRHIYRIGTELELLPKQLR